MSLADLRDLVIIIWGVAGIVALVLLAILILIIFLKVKSILDKATRTADTIQGTVSLVTGNVAEPLVRMAAFTTGLRRGFQAFGKRRRKEGG